MGEACGHVKKMTGVARIPTRLDISWVDPILGRSGLIKFSSSGPGPSVWRNLIKAAALYNGHDPDEGPTMAKTRP